MELIPYCTLQPIYAFVIDQSETGYFEYDNNKQK